MNACKGLVRGLAVAAGWREGWGRRCFTGHTKGSIAHCFQAWPPSLPPSLPSTLSLLQVLMWCSNVLIMKQNPPHERWQSNTTLSL